MSLPGAVRNHLRERHTDRAEQWNASLNCLGSLLQPVPGTKLSSMQRRFLIFVLVIAMALQGPIASLGATLSSSGSAASSQLPAGYAMADASHHEAGKKSCCPDKQSVAGCCLIAVGMTCSSAPLAWQSRSESVTLSRASAFTSFGAAPLTRPPIAQLHRSA